jgi:hypothetical protein
MPQTSKYLRLSTAHVPERLLNNPGGLDAIDGVIAYQYPEGAWLLVPDDVDEHLAESGYTPAADAKQIRKTTDDPADWPRSLDEIEALWRYARSLGCDLIRLDADEDVDPALRVYNWASADIFKRHCIKRNGETPGELTYSEWARTITGDPAQIAQRLLETTTAASGRGDSTGEPVDEVADREALVAQCWLTRPDAARSRLRDLEGEGEFRDIPTGHVDRLSVRDVALRLAELYLQEADGSDDLPAAATFTPSPPPHRGPHARGLDIDTPNGESTRGEPATRSPPHTARPARASTPGPTAAPQAKEKNMRDPRASTSVLEPPRLR